MYENKIFISSKIKLVILIIVMLVGGLHTAQTVFKSVPGIDFYQFWGVSQMHNFNKNQLHSPYAEMPRYADALAEYADKSKEMRVKYANDVNHQHYKNGIDLIGTPFIFYLFSFFPPEYNTSLFLHELLMIVSFIAGCILLYVSFNSNWLLFLTASAFITNYYMPLIVDLRVGNINCIQFFLFAFILFIISKLKAGNDVGFKVLTPIIMCLLTFILLLKPNIAVIVLLISLSIWSLRGTRELLLSMLTAGIFSSVIIIYTSYFFGSPKTWIDWLNVFADGSEKISYPVSSGNYSLALIIADAFGISINSAILTSGFIVSAFVLWVIVRASCGNWRASRYSAISVLNNHFLCASVGVFLTLAVSPLVWFHYYVLLLFPIFYLILDSKPFSIVVLCAVSSLLLTSGIVTRILQANEMEPYFVVCGLFPVFAGLLIKLHEIIRQNTTVTS